MSARNLTVKGFTLSAFNIRDADRLLRILTKEYGLITAYAGGASRPKSPLVACSMPFTLSEFVVYKHQGRYSVKSADIQYAFHGIHTDFDRLSEASRLAVLFEDASRFDSGQTSLYDLLGYALFAVADRPDPAWSAALAAFRLLAVIGYAPFLDACVACQAAVETPAAFSAASGGLLCRMHRSGVNGLIYVSEDVRRRLRKALRLPPDRLFTLSAGPERETMLKWIWHYLEYTLEKAYPGFSLPDAYVLKRQKDEES